MVKGLHLPPRHRKEIVALLHKYLPGVEVWVYGSRVNGRSHDGSDLDLVLRGPKLAEIDTSQLAGITESFRKSTVPFLIEARDWARLPKSFHSEIEREHVVLAAVAQDSAPEEIEKEAAVVRERVENKQTKKGEWQEVSIEEIALRVAMGPFGSDIKTDNFVAAGVPVIRGGNLTCGRFNPEKFVFLTDYKADELLNANAYPGDIVFTHRGTLGQVGLVPEGSSERYVISQSQMKLTCDPDLADPPYIYYFFKSPVGQYALLMHTSQTGVPAISRPVTSLKSIRLPLPPLPEQRAIAHILGTLDDKIELNRRMNETLEAMARALFKSWFVDFDPVRATMAGRDPGLPPHLADLFPDRLVDSELGEIPEGWKVGTLEDVASLNPESWSTRNAPEEIVYVDLSNTKWGYIEKVETYPWKAAPSRGRRVLRHGDTIVGTVRPGNGSFSLVGRDGLTGSTGFAVLRPKTPSDAELVWCAATSQDNIDRLAHLADGGAYPAVRPEAVAVTKFPLADFATRGAFSSVAASLLNEVDANKQQSHTLADLRDTLLPRLISGEWRAKQIEPESSISNISPDTTGVQA